MSPKPSSKQRLLTRLFLFKSRFTRGMTLGVRALVVNDDDQVFLVKHSYVPGWYLPGGGVEVGESALEAVAKELREEGNIELTAPPEFMSLAYNDRSNRRDHLAYFIVRHWRQTVPFEPNNEIIEARLFSMRDLPEQVTDATRQRVEEYLAGAVAPEHW